MSTDQKQPLLITAAEKQNTSYLEPADSQKCRRPGPPNSLRRTSISEYYLLFNTSQTSENRCTRAKVSAQTTEGHGAR